MPLAFLQFTTPWMLAGGLLAALPILSHLMHRRTRRRIVWPTVRLLAESSASQNNLFKLRRLVLLVLRCLAILAVAAAFARPLWVTSAVPAGDGGAGAAVVMVLDVSASSAQQSDGVPLVNRMRAVAGRVLNSLQEGADQVNLVYASARPEAALPQPTHSFALIRQELDALAATNERADLPGALAVAGKILATHPGQRRLVILSDMQRTNWDTVLTGRMPADLLPADVLVTIVPVEGSAPANAALGQPRVAPVQPIVGQPAQLAVQVANFAPQARSIEVEATIDGRPAGRKTVELPAGEVGDAAFAATIDREGTHRVRFAIAADDMAADDAAYLVVRAVRRVPVVIVGDDDAHQAGTATYFLSRALAPQGDMSDRLQVTHLAARDLSYGRISDAEAVLVSYVGRLEASAAEALLTYVNQGGGVLLMCDEGPMAESLAAFEKLGKGEPLLPWLPTQRRDLAAAGSFLTIGAGAWASPLLEDFDPPSREALGRIRFGRVWRTTPLAAGTAALLTYDDGTPALSERRIGAGRLLLGNFSASLTGSDLGKYGAFVALMQSLVQYLRPQRDWRAAGAVGEPAGFAAPLPSGAAAAEFAVLGPQQRPCPADLTADGDRLLVMLARPPLPGFYSLLRGGEPTGELAAVNLDPRESDLGRASAEAVSAALQSRAAAVAVRGQNEEGPILHIRGEPLWAWFVVAAMAALALELVVLCIWKR